MIVLYSDCNCNEFYYILGKLCREKERERERCVDEQNNYAIYEDRKYQKKKPFEEKR